MKSVLVILIGLLAIVSMACYPETTISSGTVSVSGVSTEDGRLSTMSKSYYVGVAEGDIAGHTAWVKTGYNASIGTTTEDMWFGSVPYVFPTAPIQMRVVSTSVEDDILTAALAPGTGIHTVWINYLDGNYIEKTTTVTLNGTVDVNTTATDIFRIQNFRATVVGTGNSAAGNISIRNISTATVYNYITAGNTRGRNNCWTVPAGKTLYVAQIAFSATGNKPVRFTTRATWDNARQAALTPGLFFMGYSEVMLQDQSYTRDLIIPTKLPEKTDIKVSAISLGGTSGECVSLLAGWIE
jgi:hypothetical protein